ENVIVRLVLRQWASLATNHDALPQLPELRQIQLLFELRLAGKHNLQQFLCGCLQVGEQTDLFQHWKCEILRFVKNEYRSFALAEAFQKPLIQFHQLLALGIRFTVNIKFCQHKVEQLGRVHPGVEQKCRLRCALAKPIQKPVHECCLTCPHLTRERDNAFSSLDAVHETRQCLLDLLRKKQIPRVRTDIKWVFF